MGAARGVWRGGVTVARCCRPRLPARSRALVLRAGRVSARGGWRAGGAMSMPLPMAAGPHDTLH
eukprot:2494879-Prymnesium_polylepis.1